jgi:hypothetical protein
MKPVHFFAMMTFCMMTFHAGGQSSFGIKADVNLSNFLTNQSMQVVSSARAGSTAGIFCKYTLNESRAVEMDMMFNYRASKIHNGNTGETAAYRHLSMELPLYAMLQADIDDQSLYLGLGPFVSVGLHSRYKSAIRDINLYEKEQNTDKATIHRFDFGVGFIIGYELKCNIQINASFQLGFRNLLGANYENVEMISTLFSFGAGYRF